MQTFIIVVLSLLVVGASVAIFFLWRRSVFQSDVIDGLCHDLAKINVEAHKDIIEELESRLKQQKQDLRVNLVKYEKLHQKLREVPALPDDINQLTKMINNYSPSAFDETSEEAIKVKTDEIIDNCSKTPTGKASCS